MSDPALPRADARRAVREPTAEALRSLGLAVLVLTTTTETAGWAAGLVERTPSTAAGVVLVVASQLLCGPALLSRRRSRAVPWALLGLLLAGMVLTAAHRGDEQLVGEWVPGYWALPALAVALLRLPRRQYAAWAATATVGLLAVMPFAGARFDRLSLADALFTAYPVAEIALFGDALWTIRRVRDTSRERERHARDMAERGELEEQARRESARLVHDHVLHALHALARAGGSGRQMLVAECRAAEQALRHRPDQAATVHVEDLLAADTALGAAGAGLTGSAPPLPSPVAAALQAAAHEALVNVERHALASSCTVEVRDLDPGVEVTIADDGRGFDPARRVAGRLGTGRSIAERMADIGGEATTASAPGRGTRVVLRWPAPDVARDDDAWLAAPEQLVRRLLTRAAWPGLVTAAAMTLLSGTALAPAWLAVGVGAGCVLAGLRAAAVLQHRPLPRHGTALLLLAAAGGWVANLVLVPPGGEVYLLWMAWGSSTLVHLLVLSLPPARGRRVVAGWLVLQLVTLALRYRDPTMLWDLSSTVTGGAGEPAVTLTAVAVAARVVAQEAAAARAAARARLATARRQLDAQLDQFWSRRVTGEALPLLEGIAGGLVDPTDPQVVATAAATEAALRDELVLGPGQQPLIAALAAARAAGWAVTSTLTTDDQPGALEAAGRLAAVLGAAAHPGQRVTLSAGGTRAMAVVLDADAAQAAAWRSALAAVDGQLDTDVDFARLVVPAR